MTWQIKYSPVVCAATGKYGVMAQEESGVCALAFPFIGDREHAEALVERLNRDQTPLAAFEDAFLRGELR